MTITSRTSLEPSFNQKLIKNFEDNDLSYLVYAKKTGGKLAMNYHVTRRLSKHFLTFKRGEFSSLKKEQDEREGLPPHAMKLQRTSLSRFATFGVSGQCIQHYSEVFKQVVPNEAEWLQDANVEFLLQLESAYSKNFELHKQWVNLYIECLHSVFHKHKLCIRAPTRINPTNWFGETMFRYTRARLQQQERTRGFLMEAYI